eukprot:221286-Amorphochlora_amoeboformis.AAC.1
MPEGNALTHQYQAYIFANFDHQNPSRSCASRLTPGVEGVEVEMSRRASPRLYISSTSILQACYER